MKLRIISALLCVSVLLSLTACSGSETSEALSSTGPTTVATVEPEDKTTAPVSEAEATEPVEVTVATTTSVSASEAMTTEATTSATTTQTATANTTTSATTTAQTTQTTTAQTTTATTASTTAPVATDEPHEALSPMMQQYNEQQSIIENTMTRAAEKQTMPVVHILTYENKRVLSKEEYVTSVIDVFNCGEEYRLTAEGGVKVRGNSTADGSEKPYRIKFDKKQNMLGLHDGEKFKSWVLLRSQWNLVPDFMGFSLAETIFDGEYYCSDCTYVNVYMNGKYLGLYLLCEQNQATEGRVEVYEPKKDETQTDIGYFIEMDNYAWQEEQPYFTLDYKALEFTDYVGTTKAFVPDDYSIKSDINTDEQLQFIKKYLDGVFWIMYGAVENNEILMFDDNYNVVSGEGVYSTPKQAVEAVIDLDSVVNTMILQELVHNYDVGAGSFFMAVDFSESSQYERLTFCAPWDFNWAYSEGTHGRYYAGAFQEPVHDMYERSNVWLTVIMKADWFREMLSEKWDELGDGAAINDTVNEVIKTAQMLENDLGDEKWRIDSAKEVGKFVKGRASWLSTQW